MRKWILPIAFVLNSMFSVNPAVAGGPCKKEDNAAHLQKELNLSNKQKDQVKQLHDQYATVVEEKSKIMKSLNEELVMQLQTPGKGTAASAALMEKFKKYQAARNDLYTTRFEMALKTRDLLTDDQIKKYKAFYHVKSKDESKAK